MSIALFELVNDDCDLPDLLRPVLKRRNPEPLGWPVQRNRPDHSKAAGEIPI
jgi:hypothetical protein